MPISPTQNNPPGIADIERIFSLQRAHQWETKASTAAERKAKLQRLKAAVEAHAEEIIAAVGQDTRKPANEIVLPKC